MHTRRHALRFARPDNGLGTGRHALALFVAIALSVLVHFALLFVCAPLHFGGTVLERERTPAAEPPPIRVTLMREAPAAPPPTPAAPDPTAEAARSAAETADRAEAAPLPTPEAAPLPAIAELPAPPPPELPQANLDALAAQAIPLPELSGVVAGTEAPRWVIPEATAPTLPETPRPTFGDLPAALPAIPNPTPAIVSKEPTVADLPKPAAGIVPNNADLTTQALAEILARPTESASPIYQDIDDRLSLSITVRDDPADPDHRYFRLEILRKPNSALPLMPKDVLIIQDVSGSIGADTLAAGKQALKAALARTLRLGDRFLVFAFRHNTLTPSGDWLTYTERARADAEGFIDSLRPVGNTDILNLLNDILTLPQDPDRPIIAVLISDGEPTIGDTRTAHIISQFAGKNDGRIAIYAFATGSSSVSRTSHYDPYFLDLLAYANRGETVTASGDPATLAAELTPIFDSIRHPVLKNPILTFDAKSAGEIHPRNLTHLFADRPLIVYGRVPRATRSVSCQLRGHSPESDYDALFTFDLAAAAQSPHDLRTAWARRALFDLLVDYEKNPSEDLRRQIDTFAQTHGLPNPYRR